MAFLLLLLLFHAGVAALGSSVIVHPASVTCTNCGSTSWPTFIALVIAAAALVIAFREHRVFMRRLRARARLELSVRVPAADEDGIFRTPGTGDRNVVVEIGLRNSGEKAASDTTLNVLVPAEHRAYFRWCDPYGRHPNERAAHNDAPGEILPDADEGSVYIETRIPRLSLRTSRVLYFVVGVSVAAERRRFAVRVKAQSDDLPDDVPETVCDFAIETEQRPQP